MPSNFTSRRSPCARADSTATMRVSFSSGDTSVTFFSFSKRSGESVHGSTLASPRTPCALRITPMAMRSPIAGSIQNVEDVAAAVLLSCCCEQRADGARRAALTANDFAQVVGRDLELDDRGL